MTHTKVCNNHNLRNTIDPLWLTVLYLCDAHIVCFIAVYVG